ncbi:TetR/AcrR family transcriptional regulator [Pelagovum pacificum]|uniref:Helix-turn-helix transcriptional regulator n=1 Tax=Pelagovum pacificum TaxID=2588711 RepID=A0A5C5G7T4_9RHOB|nr:TetR/AcrR family transcriptional regulator [Pelagovum pacificum]QQA41948.1 helix-turn-helix transcriptional regulator [Pelagovum pacificum]TNY30611.1 helix-turn-helix transcriptional regulator [Pelagovum pacificum]
MDKTATLITAAEKLFDRHGYMATGMDRLTEAAQMSSRTLYKHAGSKAELMATVLRERDRRFMAQLDVASVDALFAALADWIETEGARGCFFLRSRAETGGDTPEIADAVAAHKTTFRHRVGEIVSAELGRDDPDLTEQIIVLIEGATHAAVYRGAVSVRAARAAAAVLMDGART